VMAIGDEENDISMIEFAGIGVAMENAVPAVKEAANEITVDNDHDGVAKVIEKFALK
ncbi:HAD hydrolase family protein, partial [Ligilactobacillus salivarius]